MVLPNKGALQCAVTARAVMVLLLLSLFVHPSFLFWGVSWGATYTSFWGVLALIFYHIVVHFPNKLEGKTPPNGGT